MAISATRVKQMQSELKKLKAENARLKKRMRANGGKPAPRTLALPRTRISADENELADEILRRAGLLGELTPEEKKMAAEWRALPAERKQEVVRVLEATHFNPPLSELIMQNRG